MTSICRRSAYLENFLSEYQGCLLIVSHDRYFMDRLVDHLLVLEGDGLIRDFPGNYSQYREWQKDRMKTHAFAPNEQPAEKNEPATTEPPIPDRTKKKIVL